MRNFYYSFFLLIVVSFQANASANSCKCKIYNGTVVSAWLAMDDTTGNTSVIGATGFITDNPSQWTTQTLSINGSTPNQAPLLFSDISGNVLAVWQYADSNNNYQVAAGLLTQGSTAWNVQTISDTSETAGFGDQYGAIDESGNVIVTWSIFDSSSGMAKIRGNSTVISSTPTWKGVFTVGQ